jgi:DNA mismatch repair ATPase MutS
VRAVGDYLRRLVERGFRVAICEQIEDPRLAKGIVRRAVVETVTPGAAFADDLLDGSRDNFLVAVTRAGNAVGLAGIDVSTGAFRIVLAPVGDAPAACARFAPREVLVATSTCRSCSRRACSPPRRDRRDVGNPSSRPRHHDADATAVLNMSKRGAPNTSGRYATFSIRSGWYTLMNGRQTR